MKCVINLILIFISVHGIHGWTDTRVRRFKDDFLFGVATSAYQVEGAWNEDGKGESIWDKYLHEHPEVIIEGKNGDEACDSYHKYKRDVEMLRELGVDHYRFSISWPRVLPDGHSNKTNEKGLQYYDNLINELITYGIKPMITIYHNDLPQSLQDLGGWTSPLSVDWFLNFAKVVFERYAHKVPYWITINQPNSICDKGYSAIEFAQGSEKSDVYACIRNVLLAHAYVYRLYEKEYKKKYKGSVGIALALNWVDPKDNTTESAEATDVYRKFSLDMYMHPIWSKTGDFHIDIKRRVKELSNKFGYDNTMLPELTREEIELLKELCNRQSKENVCSGAYRIISSQKKQPSTLFFNGSHTKVTVVEPSYYVRVNLHKDHGQAQGSSDFMGMNHYTTTLVSKTKEDPSNTEMENDLGVKLSYGEQWIKSRSSWLRRAPLGLYKMCIYINLNYDYPPIFITEHGWSTDKGLRDTSRIDNIRQYLKALLYAIEDGTNVIGYTMWSLMDNVEWWLGTSQRFGLYEVDFDSKEKTRTARLSALVYKRIIKKKIIEESWNPETLSISNKEPQTPIPFQFYQANRPGWHDTFFIYKDRWHRI